jgi:hypothetical protein
LFISFVFLLIYTIISSSKPEPEQQPAVENNTHTTNDLLPPLKKVDDAWLTPTADNNVNTDNEDIPIDLSSLSIKDLPEE